MNIKKIDRAFLQSFIGGILYFRYPCFETGPDYYYLFRSKILNIAVTENGGLEVELKDLPENRFAEGKWIYHQTNEGRKVYPPKQVTRGGKLQKRPDFTKISETVVFIEIDEVAEIVLYAKEEEQPDITNCFANFPPGFEIIAGLSGLG